MANAKMGCLDEALRGYEKAVELEPSKVDYVNTLNKYKEEYKKGFAQNDEKKKPELKETTAITPVFNEAAPTFEMLIKKGDDAYSSHKYDEAVDFYTKAVILNPSDKMTMLKIANIYKVMGNNSKALSFYDKTLALDKDNTDAYFNKGLVFASQKNYDESIKCFGKVIELSPDYPYAYYSLGLAYEQKGIFDKALEYYYLYTGIVTDEKTLNVVNQRIKHLEAISGK